MRSTMVRYRQLGSRYLVQADDLQVSDARCTECGAPLLWIVTAAGARMPLDVATAEPMDNGEMRCVSHFATCPKASRFRDKKRTRETPCPGDQCTGIVRKGELLCSECWKLVPKSIRDAVWAAWKTLRSGGGRPAGREYDRACAAAIAAAKVTKANRKVRQLDAFGDTTPDPG